MALYDRLRDGLADPDAAVRHDAARRAADAGDQRLVDPLLHVALRDTAEVRVPGGLGETFEHVGDAAAVALGEILARRSGVDRRVAAAAEDLAFDDDRVATLLYYLGPRYEPLRQKLETHPQPRVRLRAARAVLSIHRSAALAARLLADPSPLLRLEGLSAPAGVRDDAACLRLLRHDPDPRVRAEAALLLRFSAVGVAPFADAAREEPDPAVRGALLACLAHRRRDPAAVCAIAALLGDPDRGVRHAAAEALRDATDPRTAPIAGAAVGLRLLAEPDAGVFRALLAYRGLLGEAPQLRGLVERLHRHATADGERHALAALLSVPPRPADAAGYTTDGRLLREVLRQAADTLEPCVARAPDRGEAAALRALRAWLSGPPQLLQAGVLTALDRLGIPEVGDCVRAAAEGDSQRAMEAAELAAYAAALRDPAHAAADPVRGPTTAARRALLLTRAAHALTARLLAAGADPPAAAPVLRLLLPGEDPVEALRSVLTVEECRRARNVAWLRLLMRPADERWYLGALRPGDDPAPDDVSDWQLDLATAAAEGRRTPGRA